MRAFLTGILIFFALALCGLSAFQWVREVKLRSRIDELSDSVTEKTKAIFNLEAQVKLHTQEIARLDALKNEMTLIIKTNRQEIASLTKQVRQFEVEVENQKAQIDVYKEAVETANQRILKQNEDIKKQNEDMKQLAEERNGIVTKFNTLVDQYNDLAKNFAKYQEDVKAATGGKSK